MTTDDLIPHPLYKVTLGFPKPLPGDVAERIGNALEEFAVSVFLHNQESADGDLWSVTLTTYGAPDLDGIRGRLTYLAEEDGVFVAAEAVVSAEKLPEKDWLRHVHDHFPPVTAGRFFVYGSHFDGEKPKGLIPLCIDAATAFGSGEHETTKGCLLAFDTLAAKHSFKNGLDMGCGSGILAIGMIKIWPDMAVAAVDIEPESIIVTERHAEMNGVKTKIATEAGDGYNAKLATGRAPYDLIAANILAGPLIAMAPALNACLQPGGFCVLSGLLARQEQEVTAAHTAQGLIPVDSIALGDWRALVFQKPA